MNQSNYLQTTIKTELPYLASIRSLTDNARLNGLSYIGTYVRCYKCNSFFHVMKDCSRYKPKAI